MCGGCGGLRLARVLERSVGRAAAGGRCAALDATEETARAPRRRRRTRADAHETTQTVCSLQLQLHHAFC